MLEPGPSNQPSQRNSVNSTISTPPPVASPFNLQLCYLQLSQALPSAMNNSIYLFHQLAYSDIIIGFLAIKTGLSYEEAQRHLAASYGDWYSSLAMDLTNYLAHCFHFYLYIAFSQRFRKGFRDRFSRSAKVKAAPVV